MWSSLQLLATVGFTLLGLCVLLLLKRYAFPAEKTWKVLEDAIHEINNHNASGLSFEELYRCCSLTHQMLELFLRQISVLARSRNHVVSTTSPPMRQHCSIGCLIARRL